MPSKNGPKRIDEPEETSLEEMREKLQRKLKNIPIQNARIAFRNFAGRAGKYNAEGRMNFVVLLDPEDGDILSRLGWNVKVLKPKPDNPDQEPKPYIQVSVSFKVKPPKVIVINSAGTQIALDEDSVNMLDWADIENIDITIRPHVWLVNDKIGVKAYLKTFYATLVEDEIEQKYANILDHKDDVD